MSHHIFLTRSLLERVSKQNLDEIVELDLSSSQCDGKLKLIENLDLLPKLELLVLRDHQLTSIIPKTVTSNSLAPSPFSAAKRLVDLDLSRNQLVTLDGLQLATNLERLNLSHNFLTRLESSVFSELHKLQQLRLSFNRIASIHSILPLTSCLHLSMLSIAGNALCTALGSPQRLASTESSDSEESSLRYLLVFLFPSLEILDGDPIAQDERVLALERWQRGHFPTLKPRYAHIALQMDWLN